MSISTNSEFDFPVCAGSDALVICHNSSGIEAILQFADTDEKACSKNIPIVSRIMRGLLSVPDSSFSFSLIKI